MDKIGKIEEPEATPQTAPSSNETYDLAPHPFNNTSADTILRTSDDVDFHVWRVILIEASPFFEDMFSLPQPRTDHSQIEPIPVTENSRTLNIMLRLCYPLKDRIPKDLHLEDVHAVLEAAMKYDVHCAVDLMRSCLLDFVETYPLRVYAIACILKLNPEARKAAEAAVKQNVSVGHYVEEFENMRAGCYRRLLQFRALEASNLPCENFDFISPVLSASPVQAVPSQGQWRDAGSPFDNSDADVIVVSQDQVRFRVHSTILKAVSPVFEDMLMNPQPCPHEEFERDAALQDVAHYIVLPHASEVLKILFGPIYYSNDIDIANYDCSLICTITTAAMTYSMRTPTLQTLKNRCLHDLIPIRAYVLAIFYDWKDELKHMAAKTLNTNVDHLRDFYEPVLEEIPSGSYVRLLQYHDKCRNVAAAAIMTCNLLNIPSYLYYQGHTTCQSLLTSTLSTAFQDYKSKTVTVVIVNKPHVSAVSQEAFYRQFIQTTMRQEKLQVACHSCRLVFDSEFHKAGEQLNSLKTAVDEAIGKIDFPCL